MALELTSDSAKAIDLLWKTWEENSVSSSEIELEATFQGLNYTKFLDIIKTLRSLGLREEQQPPRLNIMVAGGLRFTLTGDSNIEAYCNDNEIKGKPYNVMMKTHALPKDKADHVDIDDYKMRIKLRREQALSAKNVRVQTVVKDWSTQLKSFRYIHRYSFFSAKFPGLRFDASFVRQSAFVQVAKGEKGGGIDRKLTFQETNLAAQPLRYEIEVEAVPGAGLKLKEFLTGLTYVLRGIQNSYILVREVTKKRILELLWSLTKTPKDKFPGALPSTLERKNMDTVHDPAVPNLRFMDYNVTDKADGIRCILVVDPVTGKLFMIDRNLNVIGTDRQVTDVREWGGVVLDGEWVTQDLNNARVSRYYAFDIFNGKGGEDVTGRPFYIRTSRPDEPVISRLAAMTEVCTALASSTRIFKGIPADVSFDVRQKLFYMPDSPPESDPLGIFRKAGDSLRDLKLRAEYHTDGLIFTPNNAPLKKIGRWDAQLKWKPAEMNSIDFLVMFEKERDLEGRPTSVDLVTPRIHPETGQEVRCKTMYLFVGGNPKLQPREVILYQMELPKDDSEKGRKDKSEYKPIRFVPEIADPMASVCFMGINPGAVDVAGAAPAARVIPSLSNESDIVYSESGDHIPNGSIVEMSYDASQPAGWRWKPMRVRWDKTEQFSRNIISGTLNNISTANSVWTSIHEPITQYMITTGSTTPSEYEVEDSIHVGEEPKKSVYYTHRAKEVDKKRIRGMTSFHNQYIKEHILLQNVLRPGSALLDMSVGQAGDIHKWIAAKAGFVLGCDIATHGITDKFNGAYKRYMDRLIDAQAKHTTVPPMIFVAADSSKRYSDGSAGIEELDRQILRVLYGEDIPTAPPFAKAFKNLGHTKFEGFDVCAIMFALHYFFRDEMMLNGLLHNIHESLKVGGYFVGCCFDGDSVVKMFRDRRIMKGESVDGDDGDSKIWSITKQFDGDTLPATNEGIGMKIDVEFISIGQSVSEYLVSWPFLQSKLAEIGLYLLNDEELVELGLQTSSNTFRSSHNMASKDGKYYGMSDTLKQFSYLNRWFIFRRKELKNTLPELHTLPPPPPQPLPTPSSAESDVSSPATPLTDVGGSAALYDVGTEIVDMGGVRGVLTSVYDPTPILYGPHIGEMSYSYDIEFSDGVTEYVFEYLLEPIPGSDRLRYKGKRTPAEAPPLPEAISAPSAPSTPSNSMPALEANTSSNSMPALEANLAPVDEVEEAEEAEEAAEEAEEAEEDQGPKLTAATGPIYQFYHKSAAKDDLGIKLKYWRRLLSPYTPFVYHDLQDPSILYPSLEAAWHASRVGFASSKPSARASMFSVESKTHQTAETARGATEFNPDDMDSYLEEGKHYYDLISTDAKLKRAGITFNNDIWKERKEQVLIDLLMQRFSRDLVFKKIVDAIKANDVRLYYYSMAAKDNDLAGTQAGETIKGDNLLGRAIMYFAGLTY